MNQRVTRWLLSRLKQLVLLISLDGKDFNLLSRAQKTCQKIEKMFALRNLCLLSVVFLLRCSDKLCDHTVNITRCFSLIGCRSNSQVCSRLDKELDRSISVFRLSKNVHSFTCCLDSPVVNLFQC